MGYRKLWQGNGTVMSTCWMANWRLYDRGRRQIQSHRPPSSLADEFQKDKNRKSQETVKSHRSTFSSEKTSKAVLKDLNWQINWLWPIGKSTDFHCKYDKEISPEVHETLKQDLCIYLRDLFMKKRVCHLCHGIYGIRWKVMLKGIRTTCSLRPIQRYVHK